MSIHSRKVRNKKNPLGGRTGREGTVYDVSRKYKEDGVWKTYTKGGFLTREEADAHDAEMARNFADPEYVHCKEGKQPLADYLNNWLEYVVRVRNRERTYGQYRSYVTAHIIPNLGEIPLNQLTSAKIDDVYAGLLEEGLSDATVHGVRTVLSSALTHAKRKGYVNRNPASDSAIPLVRNPTEFRTLSCDELGSLLDDVPLVWEVILTLTGIYGMRISEVLGLRWRNVDFDKETILVKEQLPFNTTMKDKLIPKMNPTKSKARTLPMTTQTKYLLAVQEGQYKLNGIVYDNDLVVCHTDGSPMRYRTVLLEYYSLLGQHKMRVSRLHDLRRSAASNMYQLSSDFWTISQILGHGISGTGRMLGLGDHMQCETSQYISSASTHKSAVLQQYHDRVVPQSLYN